MLIFVAHNGKTLELANVQPATRVSDVQEVLAGLSGIALADQILLCGGQPLDAAKPLSAYRLPADDEWRTRGVFLYTKAHLRASAPQPPPAVLPPISIEGGGTSGIQYDPHVLDAAPSPLLRALPAYERAFRGDLERGRSTVAATQQRLGLAQQLLSEQEVQGLAIDAARANVEHHYSFILEQYSDFMRRFAAQRAQHAEVLARFERDMEALASAEIHPGARAGGLARLADVVPTQRLRDWAAQCARSHRQFCDKVAELEGLFGALRGDVEALLLAAPSVDLPGLGAQLAGMAPKLEEQAALLQGLDSDFARVQALVEAAVRQMEAPLVPGSASGALGALDACGAMETMAESHRTVLLPRLAECDSAFEAFTAHAADCKNQMTREVIAQLQAISAQQSKIRAMRNHLAGFREVGLKQAEAFAELALVRRVPAAYRQCLAECVRRRAFAELYAGQASQLAERMGRIREKEVAKREAFQKHVERYIPAALLAAMGLLAQPAHCQVSVPAGEAGLLVVTLDELRRLPPDASLAAAAAAAAAPFGDASSSAPGRAALQPGGGGAASSLAHQHGGGAEGAPGSGGDEAAEEGGQAEAEAEGAGEEALKMENARLRADLASAVALACAREGGTPAPLPGGTESVASTSTGAGHDAAASAASQMQAPSGSFAGSSALASSAAFQRALAAKDELVARLDAQLAAARAQRLAYENRIRQLEEQLTRAAGIQQPLPAPAPAASAESAVESVNGPRTQLAVAAPAAAAQLGGQVAESVASADTAALVADNADEAQGLAPTGGAAATDGAAAQAAVQQQHQLEATAEEIASSVSAARLSLRGQRAAHGVQLVEAQAAAVQPPAPDTAQQPPAGHDVSAPDAALAAAAATAGKELPAAQATQQQPAAPVVPVASRPAAPGTEQALAARGVCATHAGHPAPVADAAAGVAAAQATRGSPSPSAAGLQAAEPGTSAGLRAEQHAGRSTQVAADAQPGAPAAAGPAAGQAVPAGATASQHTPTPSGSHELQGLGQGDSDGRTEEAAGGAAAAAPAHGQPHGVREGASSRSGSTASLESARSDVSTGH